MFVYLLIFKIPFVGNVPESWDGNTEGDKSNNAANSSPEKLLGKKMNIYSTN